MTAAMRPLNPVMKWPIKPWNMERAQGMTAEQGAALQEMALSIFTDTVNAGHSFQAALSAVYLSGLHHGYEIAKEGTKP